MATKTKSAAAKKTEGDSDESVAKRERLTSQGGSPKVINADLPAPDAVGRSPKDVVSHQALFTE